MREVELGRCDTLGLVAGVSWEVMRGGIGRAGRRVLHYHCH